MKKVGPFSWIYCTYLTRPNSKILRKLKHLGLTIIFSSPLIVPSKGPSNCKLKRAQVTSNACSNFNSKSNFGVLLNSTCKYFLVRFGVVGGGHTNVSNRELAGQLWTGLKLTFKCLVTYKTNIRRDSWPRCFDTQFRIDRKERTQVKSVLQKEKSESTWLEEKKTRHTIPQGC